MPRRMSRPLPMLPPADLSDDKLPFYGTAELGAQAATVRFGPVSPRTIREKWEELEWRIINGRAVTHIPSLLEAAQRRFDASRIVGGRPKTAPQPHIEVAPQAV